MTKEDQFYKHLVKEISAGTRYNKRSLEKEGERFGIVDKTWIKELSELAIVTIARHRIANNQDKGIKATFDALVDLYNTQHNLSLRTSHSMMLQQYSTPAPLAYLASRYVENGKATAKYFEPSAGNGLLTIALPYTQTYVNELDDIRLSNLKRQPFKVVSNQDATRPFHKYHQYFDGITTNPPFATLDEPIKAGGFLIKHLDHAMAITALDTMKDTGRAAIIIGGHSTYDAKGRLTKGKNRIFLNYLYHHYNVEDVISINGKKLYTKQGTGFDVRLILINGRKAKPEGVAPLKNEQLCQVINSYEELFERVGLEDKPEPPQPDKKKLLKLRAKAIALKQKQSAK
ncbi:hypothetical protein KDU71_02610 [Carboxylicivirga sediminis]|uniref:Uncharacterized protein n=1 Tax=Carboxylicivirga sediminis TaxID=2006564 RepID=A0A941F0Z1_9BACT|nr:hypothetical protein [Carboxylicivirga sediminis]MBR8534437.1 hypothetical protein [Carboxylicivirga sediminis]